MYKKRRTQTSFKLSWRDKNYKHQISEDSVMFLTWHSQAVYCRVIYTVFNPSLYHLPLQWFSGSWLELYHQQLLISLVEVLYFVWQISVWRWRTEQCASLISLQFCATGLRPQCRISYRRPRRRYALWEHFSERDAYYPEGLND